MSYTRNYQETVSKTVTVRYDYPKSENGGSSSTTVTVDIPVSIDIDVDTRQFDDSISDCKDQVNLLTGSVVATEVAQIASKIANAKTIANTIVDGFFGLIKSEINQQLNEIKPRVEALIIELVQHQQSCAQKKIQFEGDFARIADRYTKIFQDLDKELRNRILALNQSAVTIQGKLSSHVHRSFSDISTGITTIYNKEGSQLQSIIFASGIKNRALSLIENARNYLSNEKNLSEQLKKILIPVNYHVVVNKHIPVVYFETKNINTSDGNIISSTSIQTLCSGENKNKLKEYFTLSNKSWNLLSAKNRNDINTFMQLELRKREQEKQPITPRIAEQIMQLWSNNTNIQSNY